MPFNTNLNALSFTPVRSRERGRCIFVFFSYDKRVTQDCVL